MWGQLRQVQQQKQQQAAASSSAQAPAPTAPDASADIPAATSVPTQPAAAAASAQKTHQTKQQQQTQQQQQQPDASSSAKTIGRSNVSNVSNISTTSAARVHVHAHVQREASASAANINTTAAENSTSASTGTGTNADVGTGNSKDNTDAEADTDADTDDKWGFDDDPFFDNADIADKNQQDTDRDHSAGSPDKDKSGRRQQFATLKSESKTETNTNERQRRRSSLLSIHEDTSMSMSMHDEDDDGDNNADDANSSSWPALIDFESNEINPMDEYADASDNMIDSSRSLGSTSRASREEKRKLDRDLALIRNEQRVDARSMHLGSMLNKTVTVVVPSDAVAAKDKDTPGKTPKVKNSKNVDDSKADVDNDDDLADNDTAAAIVGGGMMTRLQKQNQTQTQTQTQTQAAKGAGAGADDTSSMNHYDEEEEEEELIPPSSSTTSSRRLGASAGTRSAVKAARRQQNPKQKAVAKEEMKLAERKFAAAVQKITADDDHDNGVGFGDNWDFDDDDNGDNDVDVDAGATPETNTNPPGSDLHGMLVQYLSSLSGVDTPLVRSLNSLLKAELNTAENCAELIHYYTTRPQLLEYTIDTELSRMDYLVITPYDQYVDKDDIKLYVESTSDRIDDTESLIWRSSNQSLLADLIAALTGDDRLIRPSMMITAVAESCKFELNLVGGDGANRGVAVMSDLVLSIPLADGEGESSRLELGKVKARVLFVPELQQLEYSIVQATPLISPDDERLVAAAVGLERDLAELGIGDAAMAQGPHVDQLSRTAHDQLRDQFLATVSTGASGLSSALREFDSVTNVSGKLGWLKAAMPSLPTADVIAQAESEATSVHGAPPPTTHHQGSFPRPPTENRNRGHRFLDRLADEGQQPSAPPRAPPQPESRAIGFLDRLVNELEAPDQQPSQFPRPTPPNANANANHFDDNERFPRPAMQRDQPERHFQPSAPAPAPSSAAGKAPLIGGFLVRGLANAAKNIAEAAVAADDFAEASYTRPNQQKDEEVKFYQQTNVDSPAQGPRVPDVPSPSNQEKIEPRGMPSGDIDNAGDAKISANAPILKDGVDIDDSGGWSDNDDIGIDDDVAVQNDPAGTPNAPAAPSDPSMQRQASSSSENKPPEPSFRSFADLAAEKSTAAAVSVGAAPALQTFHRPVQNMPPAASAAPASIGGASVSTCDGSYQFVSMKSLQDELPEPKDWLAVEAVDAVDEQSGIIPTRSRWQPRRMRVSKC